MKTRKSILRVLLPIMAILLSMQAHAQGAGDFRPGFNYKEIDPPQPVDAAPGTVEVIEFLWYDCETCFIVQPTLDRWLAGSRGSQVSFRRMPAVIGGHMVYYARVFAAAEALGILDRIHMPLYIALHRHGRTFDTEEQIAAFFAEHGVDRTRFFSAFRGSAAASRVRNAQVMSRRYELQGAPTFVVNGKYRVDPTMVRNAEMLIDVVDYLVERELEAMR